MSDREHDLTQPPRVAGEGIRIVGAREAAAVEASRTGETGMADRRPRETLRFGDVPPVPGGPRPTLRFPLGDDGDDVDDVDGGADRDDPGPRDGRVPGRTSPRRSGGTRVEPSDAGLGRHGSARGRVDREGGDPPVVSFTDSTIEPEGTPPPGEADEGGASSSAPPAYQLPHWAEPATGEVPPILPGRSAPTGPGGPGLTSPGAEETPSPFRSSRWRDQREDWDESELGDASALGDESTRIGALNTARTEHSDLFSFDEPEPPPIPNGRGQRPAGAPRSRLRAAAQAKSNGSAGVAIGIGAAIGALFLGLARLGPGFLFALSALVVLLCATEVFAALRTAGHKPATLLGVVATVSVLVGAYTKGERALPLVMVLTLVFSLLWFLVGVMRARPTVNVAVTLLGFTWAGFLGSYAALILRPAAYVHHRDGVALMVGAAVCTVATDIGAYTFGRTFGRTPLAPAISPNKTWEGLLGGVACTVVLGTAIVSQVHPFSVGKAFCLALVVALVAPLGDLCESLIKRDIGIKDLGSLLPGHGGVFDRFDSLLFVLPAAYYLAQILHYGR
jgi:phosphatidate cytidylyltransferase